jgi:3'-phosphoadenosine 5'-phosphosulfate sulfotransferase (PAPS reductase)/FAD synthetase
MDVNSKFEKSVKFVIDAATRYGSMPWVIGFSGGKDSTIVVHVVVEAIKRGARLSKVYVIYEDTLLEHPQLRQAVVEFLNSLLRVSENELDGIVEPVIVRPAPGEDFISMMVLRGYPAPGPRFRWCTRVLKLRPLLRFVRSLERFAMVSGVRLDESRYRRSNLNSKNFIGDGIAKASFYGIETVAVMPILSWCNSDVIRFLQTYSRWDGKSYDYLSNLYGFNNLNEKLVGNIPITVRFGCWACSVIGREKMPIPQPLLEAKQLLIQVAKKDPRYREWKDNRLGKLNIEGRRKVAEIFLQALQKVPEAFGYSIKRLEECLKTALNNYSSAQQVCKDLF